MVDLCGQWNSGSLPKSKDADVEVLLVDGTVIDGWIDIHYPCSDHPECWEVFVITNDDRSDKNGVLDSELIEAWRFRPKGGLDGA